VLTPLQAAQGDGMASGLQGNLLLFLIPAGFLILLVLGGLLILLMFTRRRDRQDSRVRP
jgi:hypothetical protein